MSAETSPGMNGDGPGLQPASRLEAGNIADLVAAAARRGPQYPALIDGPTARRLTWSELDAVVDGEARRLLAAGVAPGDRVAIRLPTGVAFCVALFGVLRAGGVVVPLPTSSPGPELARIVADSGAGVLIADQDAVDGAEARVLPPPELTLSAKPDPVSVRTRGDDLAVLSYTSGTSGPPRAAMLSHRALLANARQCGKLRPMPVNAADRVLLALPLFHVYGLGPGLLQVASVGATAVLLPRFDAEEALDAIVRLRVTTVVGVPPMYAAWLGLPSDRLREGMATVRLLTSGAAPLGPEVAAAVRAATGLDVFEGYGLTETGPVVTTTLAGGHAKPGSVGRPLPGVELRLVDSDGMPLAEDDDGDTGRVSVRGPNLFSGYWPDGEHGPDADGWFRTGDVGYLDSDGDLHLVDRASDLIIVNGFNVYPHEVEHVLLELDGVVEAAVVGVPDGGTGEAVKAVVVQADGAGLSAADVREHCAARVAKFKVPAVVEFAESLPHSPTGKVARRVLRG
ncbi:long-chain acyl-CoA synthetase [Saccharopolyspora erythraea NRRL 2338]|uniref:Fatty-acid--CoA ligase n=2 Tax=Saccharopolyspora erythraea TaxID=1836 RepID=A4FPY7_SACEN|nr:AMP-binding protein [Saccharopolyspora erythraea]EQD84331.1 acyl-CoA synthetase [Saccharopolyspora erythraea D]PFG99757.1 long-chain acyl-CoA synthetase [Saccharopolyspora erythraea NRRL 2338]QRK89635.1 AMP-binding protein [Saccharopolyspora erythraea]CAM06112.1 putative fatty-acid--CoA ligase [Saccharopolyspora erythraea NRRL 2338]